jgi:hypothetical protein
MYSVVVGTVGWGAKPQAPAQKTEAVTYLETLVPLTKLHGIMTRTQYES